MLFQYADPPRSRVPRFLGYALAVLCLVWVLHDFHIVQAMHEIANVNWKWVLLGMAFDVLSYAVQALRWKMLLKPFGTVRLTRSIRAVYTGLFANLVFPLRPGEFLRSYLLATSENIKLGRVLGSLGVERLIDLVIATASLAMASLFVELPRGFNRIASILGVVTLVVLAIIVALIFYLEMKLGSNSPPDIEGRGFRAKAMGALSVLHAIGTAPSFYPALSVFSADALLSGSGLMGHGQVLRTPLTLSGLAGGSARDQSRRFTSKRAGERRRLSVLLCVWA